MPLGLALIFIAVPLIELALLIQIGMWLGFWATLSIILITAVVGTAVLRAQGLQTLERMSRSMERGEPPVEPIIDGMFLLIAGAFLLTPGVITDAIGLLLLIPAVRALLRRWGMHHMMTSANVRFHVFGQRKTPNSPKDDRRTGGTAEHKSPEAGPVIDGEFERLGDRTIDPHRQNRPRS